jgi:enoyl-CoA hydratase
MFEPEARDIGLVNHCYDSMETLMKGVMQIASTIASKSPLSIRGTKDILHYTTEHSVDDALNYISTWNTAMLLSADPTEACKVTMEKRLPKFDD